MTSIDLAGLNIGQLTDLLAKAQAEIASREKRNRKDLWAELERRLAAEGYKLGDIFSELGTASPGNARRKIPPRYRARRTPARPGAASDGPQSGCRRSSTTAESTWLPSSRSRCTRSTPRFPRGCT